jgi:hypothetical protein
VPKHVAVRHTAHYHKTQSRPAAPIFQFYLLLFFRRHWKASSDCQLRNVCPSARHRVTPTRRVTVKFHNLDFYQNVPDIFRFWLTSDTTRRPTDVYDLSLCLVFVIVTDRALYKVSVEAEAILVYSLDKLCFLRESVQTGSAVHTAPHPMGTGIRRPEHEVTSYFNLVTRLRMMELHLHSPIRFDGV